MAFPGIFSAEWVQPLGWALIHFVWQGCAIAAVLYVLLSFVRKSSVRYGFSLAALLLMMAAPAVTFLRLSNTPVAAAKSDSVTTQISSLAEKVAVLNAGNTVAAESWFSHIDMVSGITWIWSFGVLCLGLRACGGFLLLTRLKRQAVPVSTAMLTRCQVLAQRLGLTIPVEFRFADSIDSPAVLGWWRPVVLIPMSAITGLAPDQLDAVLAHELAHVKRWDSLVNLFQVMTELLLFYHPAIWWVNSVIRAERENCCDDVAITVSGDAVSYARALMVMEQWRSLPVMAVAANGSALKRRISRIIGGHPTSHSIPASAGIAVVLLLLTAGTVLAHTGYFTLTNDYVASEADSSMQDQPSAAPVPPPEVAVKADAAVEVEAAEPEQSVQVAVSPKPSPSHAASPVNASDDSKPHSSYLSELEALGFKNLSVDDIIGLKIQGVTPQYIREMRAAGLNVEPREFVSMKVLGINPQYVKDIRATGLNPDVHDLQGMRVQGVTPAYIREIRAQGWNPTIHQLIAMRVHGVNPSDAAAFQKIGITGLDVDQLIAFRVQGITPEYIQAMRSAGFKDLKTHDYVSAKVQGVTPEFIERARQHGFQNLTLRQLIGLKNADVF